MAVNVDAKIDGETMLKKAVISLPKDEHSATVVFLHGLGDTGDGWGYILREMQLPHVKVVCPTASVMPVTINNGYRMPSWFDVFSLTGFGKQDEEGLMAAAKRIHQLLDCEQEKSGLPSTRFILGGISQGGSLAMLAALTYTKPLAGIIGLSTWMSLHEKIPEIMSSVNKETPFFQCHGEVDNLVPYGTGKVTAELIQTFNKSSHTFKSYNDLGHSIIPKEIDDLKEWILKVLPPNK